MDKFKATIITFLLFQVDYDRFDIAILDCNRMYSYCIDLFIRQLHLLNSPTLLQSVGILSGISFWLKMSKKRVCEPPILVFSATFSPKNAILVRTLLLNRPHCHVVV